MKTLFTLCLVLIPLAYGASVEQDEKCAWGESYWCSDLSVAQKCGAFQHCKTTVWANQITDNQDTTEVCTFCQSLVKDVHTFISAKKTEAEIGQFFSSACAIVPNVKMAAECKEIVQKYVPLIIDLITAEVKPSTICSLIHLCTNSFADKVQHSSADHLIHVHLNKEVSGGVGAVVSKSQICTDCIKFMQDIIDQLLDPTYQSEIEQAIDTYICHTLPTDIAKECKDLVDGFLPVAFVYLKEHLNASLTCQQMSFCDSTQFTQFLSDSHRDLIRDVITQLIAALSKSDEKCSICKTVISEIRQMMQSSTIQADIKDLIKNDICASFSSIKDACVKYVDQYSQIVFEFLVTELDPATRCSSLGLCTSDSSQQDRVLHFQSHSLDGATSSSNSAECILCEEVVGELEKMLENNKTEEAIEKALDAVCDILPSKIRKSCEDFVNTYTPAIIIILQSEVSPGEVCTLLGLCSSARANTKNTPLITGNDETCLLCETVMQYVEALVEENATVSEIEAIVKKICNFLPDTVKDECNAIIDQYADEIVQYIVAKYTPKQICILIKLCTEEPESNGIKMADLTKPQQRPLVGNNKCTYGPAYWCATPGNADECQATEHCKKYVWKN